MKKIRTLCLIAALGVMITGGSLLQSAPVYAATTIPVRDGGITLSQALASVQSGDTVVIE